MRQNAAAQPVARLQNRNMELMTFQTIGGRQSSQAGADHGAFFGLLHVPFLQSSIRTSTNAEVLR
jgi:hypothetical protein